MAIGWRVKSDGAEDVQSAQATIMQHLPKQSIACRSTAPLIRLVEGKSTIAGAACQHRVVTSLRPRLDLRVRGSGRVGHGGNARAQATGSDALCVELIVGYTHHKPVAAASATI